MSGKKGSKHFGKTIIAEVKELIAQGKTQAEVATHFGFKDKYVIKELLKRERKKERQMVVGIVPKKRGRPRKKSALNEKEKDNEIKRLKMENELLRSFLQECGRR